MLLELIIILIFYAYCRHLKKEVTKCHELIQTYRKRIKELEERVIYLEKREREEWRRRLQCIRDAEVL